MRRREGGFTLVELLVVIAIIGLLAGLLLPAVSRVRSKAIAQQCAANLKDMGTAFHLFQTTFGRFPSAVHGGKTKIACLIWSKKTGFDPKECVCPASGATVGDGLKFHPDYDNDNKVGTVVGAASGWDAYLNYGAVAQGRAIPIDTTAPARYPVASDTNQDWHAKILNVLFLDGHVEPINDTENPPSTWNNTTNSDSNGKSVHLDYLDDRATTPTDW